MPNFKKISNFKFQISNFKILFLIALNFSLFTLNFQLIHAQSPLEKAQQDFTYQFSKYRDMQQNYISAKAMYETYKTATAKNEAFLKTKEYLIQIDNLYVSYLLLIKEYSGEIDWTYTNDERIKINLTFDKELAYFDEHLQKVKKAEVLEELPPLATVLKEHIAKDFQPRVNKILATYEIARTKSTFEEFKQLSSVLDEYVYSKYPIPDNSVLSNWRSEIKGIETESNSYLDQAFQKFAKITQETTSENNLKEITQLTSTANTKLQKSKSLFDEILRLL